MNHIEIIQLAIAYTLVGAFVFTVAITCLSLVGLVKFANQVQQRRLFVALILELAVGCLGVFFKFLNFSPARVDKQISANAEQRLGSDIARSIASANSAKTSDMRSVTFRTGGGAFVNIAVDGKQITTSPAQGNVTVPLAPGVHVLSWVVTSGLNGRWSIGVDVSSAPVLSLEGELPTDQRTIAGVRRFSIP